MAALLLGVVGFASQAPTAILAPIAGVWVDRWDRHRVLLVTQAAAMLQSIALAVFALTGLMTVGHLIVLGALQGLINAFDVPARQAFVVQMIDDRADLANAIALNSSMVNGTRLIGPSLAGLLIGAVGEGWCFAIDAISYVAVIASLLAMRITPLAPRPRRASVWHELADGVRYVRSTPLILAVLSMLALASLLGMPYATLMPAFAVERLGGGAHTLGFLVGASGLGALTAALYLAGRRSVVGLGSVLARAAAAFGVALVTLAFVRSPWVAAPSASVSGTAPRRPRRTCPPPRTLTARWMWCSTVPSPGRAIRRSPTHTHCGSLSCQRIGSICRRWRSDTAHSLMASLPQGLFCTSGRKTVLGSVLNRRAMAP